MLQSGSLDRIDAWVGGVWETGGVVTAAAAKLEAQSPAVDDVVVTGSSSNDNMWVGCSGGDSGL